MQQRTSAVWGWTHRRLDQHFFLDLLLPIVSSRGRLHRSGRLKGPASRSLKATRSRNVSQTWEHKRTSFRAPVAGLCCFALCTTSVWSTHLTFRHSFLSWPLPVRTCLERSRERLYQQGLPERDTE